MNKAHKVEKGTFAWLYNDDNLVVLFQEKEFFLDAKLAFCCRMTFSQTADLSHTKVLTQLRHGSPYQKKSRQNACMCHTELSVVLSQMTV
jgi:hypothetical protein